jgi:superfamily II DNA or RNA helicase
MPHDLQTGAAVHVRGEEWRLTRVEPYERCSVLTLEGRGGANRGQRLRLIEPFDRVSRRRAKRARRRTRHAVLRAALAAIAHARPRHGLWTAADAAIDLHAYQLEPALAVLRGATRVLLADAVGLGKTIQAGLVLSELRERGWVERALVVCPAGLRGSWAHELRARFGIAGKVFDQAAIADMVAALPPGINPWATHAVAVASIDFVKRPEVLAALAAVPIDLLIADEAHHVTPGTERGAAIGRLASRAPWCVFISATPHSGDQAAFEYLTGLGSHGDPIAMFQRDRRDAGLSSWRRAHVLPVRADAAEAALLGAVERYARAVWNAGGARDRATQLLAITMARRAASSATAIERTLTRRLALLGRPVEPMQSRLPWDEEEAADGSGDDAVLSARGLDGDVDERASIEQLIALARQCGRGTKIRRLLRLLDRVREPAIVFTEYRDTTDAVLAALPASVAAGCIHGGMTIEQRTCVVDAFNEGRVDLLVATDAAGEGLNLHHRCRLVIDMELPWNPLRLEQRVGRVDRIGQRRRVHAISLFHPDCVEERVLRHLRMRQRRAGLAADSCPATEFDAGRVIFEAVEDVLELVPRLRSAAVGEAAAEAQRLHHARTLRRAGFADSDRPAWARPRQNRRSIMVALRRVIRSNAHGIVAAEELDSWLVEVAAPARQAWPAIIDAIARQQAPVMATADADGHRGHLAARIASIRSCARRDRTRELQHSLFDHRAEIAAARDADAVARIEMALERLRATTDAAAADSGVQAALVAIWPLSSP